MIEPEQALSAIGQLADVEIDIADAALQLGRAARPDLDADAASSHLSLLAREAAEIGRVLDGRSLEARAGALAALIHARHRYAGDTESYDSLDNANLLCVTERRLGLPVSLGIVWLHCVRAAGWQARGIDFPGHFLLQLEASSAPAAGRRSGRRDGNILLDVFAGGITIGMGDLVALMRRQGGNEAELRPGMLRPMSNREVLLRLQRNIVERQRATGDLDAALEVLGTMLAVAPDQPTLWREAAGLNQLLVRFTTAIECLERFVALVPEGDEQARARARIEAMRTRLA